MNTIENKTERESISHKIWTVQRISFYIIVLWSDHQFVLNARAVFMYLLPAIETIVYYCPNVSEITVDDMDRT